MTRSVLNYTRAACDCSHRSRVATNLENLEYSGISLNMENSRNSQGILCSLRKNCNKQSIFSLSFKYLCKTAVDWVNEVSWISDMVRVRWWPVILLELMWNNPWWRSLLHLLFVAMTYGKVSLSVWRSLENSEFVSPTLWPPWEVMYYNYSRAPCAGSYHLLLLLLLWCSLASFQSTWCWPTLCSCSYCQWHRTWTVA